MATAKSKGKLLLYISFIAFIFLFLMSVYRLFFYQHYLPSPKPFSGSTFLLGLRFDFRVIGILALIMIILSSFSMFHPLRSKTSRKVFNGIATVLFFFTLLIYVFDFYHFDYLKERLNASVLNYSKDAAISTQMMWQTYPVVRVFILLLLLTALFYWGINKLAGKLGAHPQRVVKRSVAVRQLALPILVCAVFVFGRLGQYPLRWSDAFGLGDTFKAQTSLNPFQSFASTLKFKSNTYNSEDVKWALPMMANYFNVGLKDSSNFNLRRQVRFPANADKKNVVIVLCESFAAAKSSMYNPLDPTPYFSTLCNNGLYFSRCFTPSFGTARGVWALITGIPDVEPVETASRNPNIVDQHTIINDFDGYNRFYFLGGSTTWANIRGLIKNNIDSLQIYEQENFDAKQVDVWGISDKNLFLEANKILTSQSKPFISIIQTADNHRPYTIPKEDLGVFNKIELPKDTLEKYGFENNAQYNAFRYADFCIKTYMEAASKEAYFDNTLFVFVGDHGFRDPAGQQFPRAYTEQAITAHHVPLLFYAPGFAPKKKDDQLSSQLDVLPTAAAIVKQSYTNTTLGRDLTDTTIKNPMVFITETDATILGLLNDPYYFFITKSTNQSKLVSILNNDAVSQDAALLEQYRKQTLAWFFTSQYLLKNNKRTN